MRLQLLLRRVGLVALFLTATSCQDRTPPGSPPTTVPAPAAPAARVSGTVVDDATGEPIPAFTVIPGFVPSPDQPPVFLRIVPTAGNDGQFEVRPPAYGDVGVVFRIEAEGYDPAVSEVVPVAALGSDPAPSVAVRLRKAASAVTGTLTGPDGQPLADVAVYLATEAMPLDLIAPDLKPAPGSIHARTDAQGRFRLPSQGEVPFRIVALTDAGLATATDADRTAAGEIPLVVNHPWGSIAGTYAGDRGASKVGVTAHFYRHDQDRPLVSWQFNGETGSDGTFRFDRVPAGEYLVGFFPPNQPPVQTPHPITRVEPGQIADASFGATGRAVIGRLVLPSGETVGRWRASLNGPWPAVGVPEGVNASPESAERFLDQFRTLPEFELWRKQNQQNPFSVVVDIAADGSFTTPRTPPGLYQLTAFGSDAITDPDQGTGVWFADVSAVVAVESAGDGQADAQSPVSIGDLPVRVRSGLRLGRPLPPITGPLADGGAFDLAAYTGKVVVLDIGHLNSSLAEARTDPMRGAIESWLKPDSGVAIVGVNLNPDLNAARKTLAAANPRWPVVLVGGSTAATGLGMHSVPGVLVLDRNHRLAGMNLTEAQLLRLVGKLREGSPAAP